jgi:hypothetical protein
VEWGVNYTNEFEVWWDGLDAEEQEDIDAKVILLQRVGPSLGRPHADTIRQSKHNNMKELIIQHGGDPYRVFFAFDPKEGSNFANWGNENRREEILREVCPHSRRFI